MLDSFMVYLLFFTRIPIKYEFKNFEKSFRNSIWFLPIFGLIYGGFLSLIFAFSMYSFRSLDISIVILIIADAMISGALHYDALADTADGLFSGREPERMKEIMRDSRIGTYGTVALISYFFLFFFILRESLAPISSISMGNQINLIWQSCIYISGVYMVSKAGMSFLHLNYKYANSQGQGKVSENIKTYQIIISQIISLSLIIIVFSFKAIFAYLITTLFLCGYKLFVHKKIYGMTGDTLGATCQITNIIFPLAMIFINNIFKYII